MSQSLIDIAREAAKLLRDIDRNGGLKQGGEQYPNGLCCLDVANRLEKITKKAANKGVIKPIDKNEYERAKLAFKEGYAMRMQCGFIIVENPKFTPDNGELDYLIMGEIK